MSLEMSVQKKKKPLADRLAAALRNRAHKTNGTAYWTSAGFSRWGNDRFEITAAAMKALVAYAPNEPLIIDVLAFFAKTKRGQRWNSTKDTAMIIFAICDYLATQESGPGKKRIVTVQVNDGTVRKIKLITGNTPRFTIPGRLLHHGDNQIRFHGVVPGAMFRAVFHYWKRGRNIAPLKQGLTVTRRFFLLSEKGSRLRELKPGDNVPRGSYLESLVTVRRDTGQSMRYVLVENAKPATCEILPVSDRRFNQSSTAHALREDKTAGVAWHHEQTGSTITDRCVLHAELAGEYRVPPAHVELMYQTDVRGHSGAFHFNVVEPAANAVSAR